MAAPRRTATRGDSHFRRVINESGIALPAIDDTASSLKGSDKRFLTFSEFQEASSKRSSPSSSSTAASSTTATPVTKKTTLSPVLESDDARTSERTFIPVNEEDSDFNPNKANARRFSAKMRGGYIRGAATSLSSVSPVVPNSSSSKSCPHDLLYLLYDTLGDAFRCFVLMFNNTSHAFDPAFRSYTKEYKSSVKTIDAKSLNATYFKVRGVAVPVSTERSDEYFPMDLRLPYINKTNYMQINMTPNFDRATFLQAEDQVLMLFYTYLSMVLDMYIYMKNATPKVRSVLSSTHQGCLNDVYYQRTTLLLDNFLRRLSSKNPRHIETIYNVMAGFFSNTLPPDTKNEKGVVIPNLWRYFLKIDTSFVKPVEAFLLDYFNVLECQAGAERDVFIVVGHRTMVNGIAVTLAREKDGYFSGMQILATTIFSHLRGELRTAALTREEKAALDAAIKRALLTVAKDVQIINTVPDEFLEGWTATKIDGEVYNLFAGLTRDPAIQEIANRQDIDSTNQREIEQAVADALPRTEYSAKYTTILSTIGSNKEFSADLTIEKRGLYLARVKQFVEEVHCSQDAYLKLYDVVRS